MSSYTVGCESCLMVDMKLIFMSVAVRKYHVFIKCGVKKVDLKCTDVSASKY